MRLLHIYKLPSFKRRLQLHFSSVAMHPSVSNNYRVMALRFTVLLRDLEAFLHYVTIVAFRVYLLTHLQGSSIHKQGE